MVGSVAIYSTVEIEIAARCSSGCFKLRQNSHLEAIYHGQIHLLACFGSWEGSGEPKGNPFINGENTLNSSQTLI